MYRRFTLVLLIAWLPWLACAAPPGSVADSLRRLIASGQPDTAQARRLLALGTELVVTDAPGALLVTRQARALARQLRAPALEALALLRLSTLHRRNAAYDSARWCALAARRLFRGQHDASGQAKTFLQLSLIETLQGNLDAALYAALRGLPLAERAGDLQTQARLRATVGKTYFLQNNYANALPMLHEALRDGEALHDQLVVGDVLNTLGNTYQLKGDLPAALRYYRRAAQLAAELGDVRTQTTNETNIAEVLRQQGRLPEALAQGRRARALAQANQDLYNLPTALLALAAVHLAQQQPDSTVALALRGFALGQQARSKDNLRSATDLLARAYARRDDYRAAYRYQTLHLAYQDSLSGEEMQRQTATLRYGYELGRKQDQIALLTKNRQLQEQRSARQRQQVYGLLAGLLGVALLAGLLWRNIVLKQRANRYLNDKNAEVSAQRDALDQALHELQAAQALLVQHEKMASLGELTAGVAHEIQNPLNFVNNFAEVSQDLVTELQEELDALPLPPDARASLAQLLHGLAQNQLKIQQHGRRADGIVKSMLAHSRAGTGQAQPTDLNALCDEYLRLSYHGLRARHPHVQVGLRTAFDPHLPKLNIVPQDLSRVLLNLFTNAFYAVTAKQQQPDTLPGYQPEVSVRTSHGPDSVEIRIRDNGLGVPPELQAKIFQPFFTTKPVGEGTGLGLSLSHDIVAKGYGGTLRVESEPGQYAEFIVALPTTAPAARPARPRSAGVVR